MFGQQHEEFLINLSLKSFKEQSVTIIYVIIFPLWKWRKYKNISLVKQKIIKDVTGWYRTEEITMDYNLETQKVRKRFLEKGAKSTTFKHIIKFCYELS